MNNNFFIPQTAYLKNVIRSIWQVDGLTPFQNETIIPKGIIEVIFNFSESERINGIVNGKPYQLPNCFINGLNTCPIYLQLPEQQTFFGVQFHPIAIRHHFGAPACDFTNRAIDLALLNLSFHSLWHQLAEKKTFNERVTIITKWLESKIIQIHPQEQLLNSFFENSNQHTISVTELSKTLCYSSRHLYRKIYELTKMNTEEVLLYKKYLCSVHLIHHSNLALTEIAYHSNFADQSHFIKAFKSFATITPGDYKKLKSPLQGHFYQNVR